MNEGRMDMCVAPDYLAKEVAEEEGRSTEYDETGSLVCPTCKHHLGLMCRVMTLSLYSSYQDHYLLCGCGGFRFIPFNRKDTEAQGAKDLKSGGNEGERYKEQAYIHTEFGKAVWDKFRDESWFKTINPVHISVSSGPAPSLILRPGDKDDDRFVLISHISRVKEGLFAVHGWITAKDGKQEKYWHDPKLPDPIRPAWFVPPSDLRD